MRHSFGSLAASALIVVACGRSETPQDTSATANQSQPAVACSTAGTKDIVVWFGRQLQNVSLLAADSIARRQIRESYGPFVTQELLDKWLAQPSAAPGRKTSSPWPDRIEIDSVAAGEANTCIVSGRVIYVTSVPSESGALRETVKIVLRDDGGWKLNNWEQ